MAKIITCPSCQGLFKLPATYSGKNLRCPRCRAVIKLATEATTREKTKAVSPSDDTPTEGLPSISLGHTQFPQTSFSVGPTEGPAASSFRWSHPAVFVLGLVILIAVGAPITITWYQRSQRESRRQALVSKLQTEVNAAEAAANRFDFGSAIEALEAIRPIVCVGYSDVDDMYDAAHTKLVDLKNNYEQKVQNGYSVYEGKLLPSAEIAEIVAKRKNEERQRQEEERRQEEKERRREQRERKQEQENARQAKMLEESNRREQQRISVEQDPVSDFKSFSERFGKAVAVKWDSKNDFSNTIITSIDVQRTNSLVSPCIGILTLQSSSWSYYRITFAAQNGRWVYRSYRYIAEGKDETGDYDFGDNARFQKSAETAELSR